MKGASSAAKFALLLQAHLLSEVPAPRTLAVVVQLREKAKRRMKSKGCGNCLGCATAGYASAVA